MRFLTIVIAILLQHIPAVAEAMDSENFALNQSLFCAGGNTTTSTGKTIYPAIGEHCVGQSYSQTRSLQAGFFNEYFLLPPTPTVTPTITVTLTPIRSFGGAILNKDFVYTAPSPIRGKTGRIFFDLAAPAEVWLTIYTLQQKLVLSRHWEGLPPGTNQWEWDTANMPNGVYFLQIKARDGEGKTTEVVKKIALIK